MSKKYLLSLWLLPIVACAQITISTNEHATKALMPDVLRVQIGFKEEYEEYKDSNVIKEHLNALVAELKRFDTKGEFCHGGGYYISPRYTYKDQKQIFMGYSGSLSFGCDFNSIAQYNTLIAKLDKQKASHVRVNIGALSWTISDKAQSAARLSLRSEVLHIAQEQAHNFSNETTMQCSVSAIAFEGTQPIQPVIMETMRANKALKSESVPTEEPLQHAETLSLGATVSYMCLNPK